MLLPQRIVLLVALHLRCIKQDTFCKTSGFFLLSLRTFANLSINDIPVIQQLYAYTIIYTLTHCLAENVLVRYQQLYPNRIQIHHITC